jgi:hypothetical protein
MSPWNRYGRARSWCLHPGARASRAPSRPEVAATFTAFGSSISPTGLTLIRTSRSIISTDGADFDVFGTNSLYLACDNTTVAPRSTGESKPSTAGEHYEGAKKPYRCPSQTPTPRAPHDAGERSQSDGGRSFLARANLPSAGITRTSAPLSLRTAFGVEPGPHIQRTESLCGGARCCGRALVGNESRGAETGRSGPLHARSCIRISENIPSRHLAE